MRLGTANNSIFIKKADFVSQQTSSPFDDRLEAQYDIGTGFQYLRILCRWSWRLQLSLQLALP